MKLEEFKSKYPLLYPIAFLTDYLTTHPIKFLKGLGILIAVFIVLGLVVVFFVNIHNLPYWIILPLALIFIYWLIKQMVKDAINESIGNDLSEIIRLLEKKTGEDIDDYDEKL